MSRAQGRRYRVRFAVRGAAEVSASTVEFTLYVLDTAEHPLYMPPVVAGSFVHPLDGATELRPLHVLGLDKNGALIEAFTEGGRWAALGRLLDIQWQDYEDDPDTAPWTTYGTGRCSGLDELDGPGLFRVEVSDESYVARTGRVFESGGTTAIWPWGILRPLEEPSLVLPAGFAIGRWKGGYEPAISAGGALVDTSGGLYRIQMTGQAGAYNGRRFPEIAVRWIRGDLVPEDDIAIPGTSGGNFRHLRLRYRDTGGALVDFEIVSFGALGLGPPDILNTVVEPETLAPGAIGQRARIHAWIRPPSGVTPASSGPAWLCAPTAEPDRTVPFHIPVTGHPEPWGVAYEEHGFMHVADFTRRLWTLLGVRFDADNLDELEEDKSFPAVAVRIDGVPQDPEKWAQEMIWGPRMLIALKDIFGRRKLKDLRPPTEDADLSAFPLLDRTNSKLHRWGLRGHEAKNSIEFAFEGLTHPAAGFPAGAHPDLVPDPDALDGFLVDERALPLIDGDTVPFINRRVHRFDTSASLVDPALSAIAFDARCLASSAGVPFRGDVVDQYAAFLLGVYQDGPFYVRCEVSGSLAETIEEGDYAVVNCASVKLPNADTAARTGYVLVLILSLTRHPAHADAEYIVIRPVHLFECPTEEDPSSYLYSPFNETTTMRMTLSAIEPRSGLYSLTVTAHKNATGGQQVDLGVAIYEGATLIAEWLETDIVAVSTTYLFTLTSGQQASIVDWGNLFIEITRGGATGGPESDWRQMIVTDIEGNV